MTVQQAVIDEALGVVRAGLEVLTTRDRIPIDSATLSERTANIVAALSGLGLLRTERTREDWAEQPTETRRVEPPDDQLSTPAQIAGAIAWARANGVRVGPAVGGGVEWRQHSECWEPIHGSCVSPSGALLLRHQPPPSSPEVDAVSVCAELLGVDVDWVEGMDAGLCGVGSSRTCFESPADFRAGLEAGRALRCGGVL